jgi:hypothetical protein
LQRSPAYNLSLRPIQAIVICGHFEFRSGATREASTALISAMGINGETHGLVGALAPSAA